MKTIKPLRILQFIIVVLVCISCVKESVDNRYTTSVDSPLREDVIPSFVPDDAMEKYNALQMPINYGTSPILVPGSYHVSPCKLKSSSDTDDVIECKMSNLLLTLSEVSPGSRSIIVQLETSIRRTEGIESVIIGEGNVFTIFSHIYIFNSIVPGEFMLAISGEFVENGIKNMHVAFYMLDDNGDPYSELIDNCNCRVLYDADSISWKFENEFDVNS